MSKEMKKGFTSVIMTTYMQNYGQSNMTREAINNITKYTDAEDFELILMSDNEVVPVRDWERLTTIHKTMKIDQYVKTKDLGWTGSMNKGASLACGEFLAFIQNDIYVWEGWLENLRYYLEKDLGDYVAPDQNPKTREFVKQAQKMTMAEGMKYGGRDAGLHMLTRKAFDKLGGFDERLSLLADRDLYERMGKLGIRQIDTSKVLVTHLAGATNRWRMDVNNDEYQEMMDVDAKILNK